MSAVRVRLLAAAGVVVTAMAVALEATTFDVAFPTDPLGPKAFPMVAAALLVLGGAALVREARLEAKAGEPSEEPGGQGAADEGAAAGAGRRIALATVSFVAYALLLAPLGFVTATTLEFAVLARLFGGPLGKGGAGAGLIFALALYVFFVYGLGLPLPLGVFEA